MQETYITLEEAARFEGISYKGLTSRISRNPARYKTRTEAREGGGKELVLLSTASLSQKGRRAYRAQIRAMAEPEEAGETAPWYVEADLGSYIEQHKRAYYEAVELARRVQDFLSYAGPDRTGYGPPSRAPKLGQKKTPSRLCAGWSTSTDCITRTRKTARPTSVPAPARRRAALWYCNISRTS